MLQAKKLIRRNYNCGNYSEATILSSVIKNTTLSAFFRITCKVLDSIRWLKKCPFMQESVDLVVKKPKVRASLAKFLVKGRNFCSIKEMIH